MSLSLETKSKIISDFGCNHKDSGATEVQIAILTARIAYLQLHFMEHDKDNNSKRGLLYIISHRRKLIKFLKKKNIISYNNIINKLKLRK